MPEIDSATAAGARAAILARLWGALDREPIAGLAARQRDATTLTVVLSDDRRLVGPLLAAALFAPAEPGLAVALDGTAYTDPAALVRTVGAVLGRHVDRLVAELANSVDNLALARSAQPAPDDGPAALTRAAGTPDPLAYLEQSVVDGHPLHPGARTRLGLTADEVRAYAPEHRPVIALRRVPVAPERWYGVDCAPELLMHPWQYDHLRQEYPWLRASGDVPARPLMSLRTVSLVDEPAVHVKTAVDLQLTSAVRTVSPASVHNGPLLSRLLTQLVPRVPGLTVLAETAAGAVIVDGEPNRRLAMVRRQVPTLARGELALPLAVLSAPSPATGSPIVAEVVESGYGGDPLAGLTGLAEAVLAPVFALLRLGVALEAHGQNVLAVVRDGRFARVLYRDFGGVRVSARQLARSGIVAPALRGDIASDDPSVLATKVLAALGTALGDVVAALTRGCGVDPDKAWHEVAAVARRLPAPDALFAGTLPVKATTAMRLADAAVADIWAAVPNPMAGLR